MLKHKKLLSLVAVLLSSACLLAGCGGPARQENASPITYPEDGSIYPMVCEDELTVWSQSLSTEDLNSSPIGLAWQEQTGAKIKFEQPVNGNEALNTLLASGDLPDIIISTLAAAPGGIQKQVEDEIIIELDEYLEAYAPNLMAYLKANPDIDKEIKSDDGHYYYFPFVRGDERLSSSCGIALRKDLLDKAGLDIPVTIDDWTEVLRAYKAQGVIAPLSFSLQSYEYPYGYFSGAWNVAGNYYLDNGVAKYGFMEDGMIEAIKTFKMWYDEGLLDRNIVSVPDIDGQIIQGQTAASVMWAGGGIGKYMNAKPTPDFELVAVAPPVLEEGQISNFGGKELLYNSMNNAYITTECKNIELAVRFLDYAFGEAGHILINFGIEGESFEYVDGVPTYTDIILKPEGNKSISEAMKPYLFASGSFPGVQDFGYLEQYYQLPQQREAVDVWSKCNSTATRFPNIAFTSEESEKLAEIRTNIETYSLEMWFKFITGAESLDNYDAFREQLVAYGVEDAIQIFQDAYDRYQKR